jgi:methylmalonyl-CoA mutase cobalamin-binding subunit
MSFWLFCLLLCSLLLPGCVRQDLHDLVEALNARGVSNCLYISGAFPPYGNAYLYAKSGELPCTDIWQARRLLEGP